MMNLLELLETRRKEIIDEASESLFRARLRHYEASGMEQNRQRLEGLYALTLECVRSKDLVPMLEYSPPCQFLNQRRTLMEYLDFGRSGIELFCYRVQVHSKLKFPVLGEILRVDQRCPQQEPTN